MPDVFAVHLFRDKTLVTILFCSKVLHIFLVLIFFLQGMRYTGELPVYMKVRDQMMELDSAILYEQEQKHYTTLLSKATHW